MTPSNQTRRRAAKAALVATPFAVIAVLGEIATLASRLGGIAAGALALIVVAALCYALHNLPSRRHPPVTHPRVRELVTAGPARE